jgi:chromosome segregation ATPase
MNEPWDPPQDTTAAKLALVERQYAELSTQTDHLVTALQKCREERDAYAAATRDEGKARYDAEARLEAVSEELASLGAWVERIRRRCDAG